MDSVGRIVSSMQHAAVDVNLPVPTDEAVKDIIGLSLKEALHILFGALSAEDFERLTSAYRDHYVNKDETPTPLFAGSMETLKALKEKGYLMAVATGKARQGLVRVWAQTDTEKFFDFSCCADEAASKPSPQMIENILNHLDVKPEDTLMVGDSCYDMQMAKAAGVDRIGVSFGVHNETHLLPHGPLTILDDMRALLNWV